jgi:single-strand DNA-binding protein
MINRVVLVGRLTRDVELRYTSSGDAVGRFTIAVERNFTNASGEREADFISATIWRKAAENFANFTGRGALVAIEGSIRTGSYQNQEGQTVYTTEVNVDNFTLLETRSQSEARRSNSGNTGAPQNSAPVPPQSNNSTPSFNPQQPQTGSAPVPPQNNNNVSPWNRTEPSADAFEISENDLPFED